MMDASDYDGDAVDRAELLDRISWATLDTLAILVRDLSRHELRAHNCAPSAELIDAIASRLDALHAGLIQSARRGPRDN